MKTLKNNNITFAIVILTLATGLCSCKKDSAVKPSASASQMSFGLRADNTTAVLASASGIVLNSIQATTAITPVISWTTGTANVAKFKFEAKKAGVETEIEARGLTNVNLFAIDQAFVGTKVDTGTYSEIEFKLELAKSAGANIPLVLKGSFTNAAAVIVPVELDVNEDLEIKTEINNVVIDNTTDLKTTFMLHLDKMFTGITSADLASATLTSGTLVISSTSNSALYNKIKANLVNVGGHDIEGEHHGHNGSDDKGGDSHSTGH
ncbi:hypothetical protein BH09BAC6_BH09BAC6_32730 [soil metagenome]|jgi:hypothetical protein